MKSLSKVLFALPLSLAGIAFFLSFLIKILFPSEITEIIKNKKLWDQTLNHLDTRLFYQIVKYKYHYSSNQHAAGHILGELIYKKHGPNGLAYCDDSFYWGCYHSLISQSISQNGPEILDKLIKIFPNSPNCLSCFHGLGHGLAEYFGPKKLTLALDLCDSAGGSESCYSGVFMQDNFPVSSKNLLPIAKSLDQSSPMNNCEKYPPKFQASCYFELPRWWLYGGSEDFSPALKNCSNLANEVAKHNCFRGLGEMLSMKQENVPQSAIDICLQLPLANQQSCLHGLATGFYSDFQRSQFANSVCNLLNDKKSCP